MTSCARAGEPGVVGRAEAGVVRQLDDLGAAAAGERGPAVARARVDHDELRALGEVPVERVQQPRELGLGVVQDDDRGERASRGVTARRPPRRG